MTDRTPPQALWRRLSTYTNERFPLKAYVPMILLASWAATGFARTSARQSGLSLAAVGTAAITLLAGFFALRVADEHKDATSDRAHRPELPVARGLVTLAELRGVAATLAAVAIVANVLRAPALLITLALVVFWLTLMTLEFFARDWLRARPALYLASHMVSMPLLLLHATAVDWLAEGRGVPRGLGFFLAASYATGLVLEVGRKIRAPADERPGVETYTSVWGARRALTVWMLSLMAAAALIAAAGAAVGSRLTVIAAPLMAVAVTIPVRRALSPAGVQSGKAIERASAAWTFAAYALLALPWLERAFS